MQTCPCGTKKNYVDCCGPFISQQQLPSTPEKLMRSRYTAYTQANIDYIVATMRSPAADNFDYAEAVSWAKQVEWLRLEVITATGNLAIGLVEFRAHFMLDQTKHVLHEISEFHYLDHQWYYINGSAPKHVAPTKIGVNAACPCGSEKKYKKCCGKLIRK